MMTERATRKAIIERLEKIRGSCGSIHLAHNEGVFRGLIWALTGKDPGTYLLSNVARMLTLAGIANRTEGEQTLYDEDLDGEI